MGVRHDFVGSHRDGHEPANQIQDVTRVVRVLIGVIHDAGGPVGLHLVTVNHPLKRAATIYLVIVGRLGDVANGHGTVVFEGRVVLGAFARLGVALLAPLQLYDTPRVKSGQRSAYLEVGLGFYGFVVEVKLSESTPRFYELFEAVGEGDAWQLSLQVCLEFGAVLNGVEDAVDVPKDVLLLYPCTALVLRACREGIRVGVAEDEERLVSDCVVAHVAVAP